MPEGADSMLSMIFTTAPLGIALLIGIAVPVGIFIMYRITRIWTDTNKFAMFLWAVIIRCDPEIVLREAWILKVNGGISFQAFSKIQRAAAAIRWCLLLEQLKIGRYAQVWKWFACVMPPVGIAPVPLGFQRFLRHDPFYLFRLVP